MEITFRVDADGVSRAFRVFGDPRVLDRPLKQFGGYLRKRVAQRFATAGPGWPPRAASTTASALGESKIQHAGDKWLLRSLRKSIRRAMTRAESKAPGNLQGRLRSLLRRVAQERVLASLIEHAPVRADDQRTAKALGKLRDKQAGKAHGIASKPLGRLASSIFAQVRGGTLTVASRVPWAGVHNEGGTVGHNAKVPARSFLYLEAVDVAALEWLLVDALGAGFVKVD